MQMMTHTIEIVPTYYQKKLKDRDGNLTGETEPVIQFEVGVPVQYNLSISPQAKKSDELLQKLILAADNGDSVIIQGHSDVRNYANGGTQHLFKAVSVDYNPKPMINKA